MATEGQSCGRFSRRALRTLAAFGLTVDDLGVDRESRRLRGERAARLASKVLGALPDGRVGVITGPSGAGKSTVLRTVGEAVRARGGCAMMVEGSRLLEGSRRRAIDLAACVLSRAGGEPANEDAAMRLLASAGLADVRLAVMPACELSEGERTRLSLALTMGKCEGGPRVMLLVDEFGASLDEATAISVAGGLARWVGRTGARATIVTHRPEVIRVLRPRVVVRLRGGWIHGLEQRKAA